MVCIKSCKKGEYLHTPMKGFCVGKSDASRYRTCASEIKKKAVLKCPSMVSLLSHLHKKSKCENVSEVGYDQHKVLSSRGGCQVYSVLPFLFHERAKSLESTFNKVSIRAQPISGDVIDRYCPFFHS